MKMKSAVVYSTELGSCWSAARFCEGERCKQVMDCTYPERDTCKAVRVEREYLKAYYIQELAKLRDQQKKAMENLKRRVGDAMSKL